MSDTDLAIEILGEEKVSCIRKLFGALEGNPPQVGKQRYRADNVQDLEILDQLEHSNQLIKCDNKHQNYRLSPYALPLVRSKKSEELISIMNHVYSILKELYMNRLGDSVSISEMFKKVDFPKTNLQEALYYMFNTHDVWCGKSNDFPYDDDSSFCISESVIRRKDFIDVLEDYYRWHLINPQTNLSEDKLDCLFKEGNLSRNRNFSDSSKKYPEWFQELGDTEKSIIVEIDEAMKTGLKALPLMGIRALLENIMLSYIDDKKTFKKNLKEFEAQGYVTEKIADILFQVIDAGSAVMHRAHIPSGEDVKICMDVVINLIQSLKILNPKVDDIHKQLPKRK